MNKRRLGNFLKRKLSICRKSLFTKNLGAKAEVGEKEFIKNQLQAVSRLGGDLIVMRMGS